MSDDPLFSEHWYRVKQLQPSLATDVVSALHRYRGHPVYVLQRRSGGGLHRLDSRSHALIARLNGRRTVAEIWEDALARFGEEAPGQPELMRLLAELHAAGLVVVDRRVDAEYLFGRADEQRQTRRWRRWMNPLFIRFPLFDPNRLLDRHKPLADKLFSRAAAVCWLSLFVVALMSLLPESGVLLNEIARTDFLAPTELMLFGCCWLFMKSVHELAHALALKRFGCEVHEVGIALMVLLPIPYVDASSAGVLANKYQRILISAAGILCELAIAAIALLVWLGTSGQVAELALRLMLIGGVSTVVFNANPLLRFDGYYMLSDWLEIPELERRGKRFTLATLRRFLFGARYSEQEAHASAFNQRSVNPVDPREGIWLLAHCLLSVSYRVVLVLGIALMLSQRYFFFGKVLAFWALFAMFAMPLWKYLCFLTVEWQSQQRRALLASLVLAVPASALLMFVPLPASRTLDGIVWLPENAMVRPAGDCEIVSVDRLPGSQVKRGDEILRCENAELAASRAVLTARLAEIDAQRTAAALDDALKLARLESDAELLQERLALVDEQIAGQTLTASHDGQLLVDTGAELTGRFLARGEQAAVIVPERERVVRLALPEIHITELQPEKFQQAELRIAGKREAGEWQTLIRAVSPHASHDVISAALTRAGGGRLKVRPGGADTESLDAVFDVELAWPDTAPPLALGSRVAVRLIRNPETIVQRASTSLKQLLMHEATRP